MGGSGRCFFLLGARVESDKVAPPPLALKYKLDNDDDHMWHIHQNFDWGEEWITSFKLPPGGGVDDGIMDKDTPGHIHSFAFTLETSK